MKNALPYYKRYPRDFMEGTAGMTFEQKGAYSILLDMIYMQNGKLPDDERWIAGLLGCSTRQWKKLRAFFIETGKITVNGKFLTNDRANFELKSLEKFQEKQSSNALARNKNNDIDENLAEAKTSQPEPEPDIEKKPTVSKRGTRLPEDFPFDPEPAIKAGLNDHRAHVEFEKFKNYWLSTPGQKGVKLDWKRTWQNWCMTAAERSGGGRAPPQKSAFRQHQDAVRESFEKDLRGNDPQRAYDDGQPTFDLGREDFRRN